MNDQANAVTTTKPADPIVQFKNQVSNNEGEFRAALPAHIPVERFVRVVTTAVISNPDLLHADRRSLFESAVKAAQDGLLPDGRDGALVIYNVKIKGKDGERDQWIKKVQWMPMIAGILKKVRNSGELISISAYVAHENDEFVYELGDQEKITHKPALENRGPPKLVYAVAKTKDGGIYREVMTVAEIESVRAVSRAKDSGPWVQWWGEMARKTVMRRLSKRLPMSSDLDDLIRRDDALYDFEKARDAEKPTIDVPRTLAAKLDALASGKTGGQVMPPHDETTGEILNNSDAGDAGVEKDSSGAAPSAGTKGAEATANPPAAASAPDDDFPGDRPSQAKDWREEGRQAARDGLSRKAIPSTIKANGDAAKAWLAGFDETTAA